MENLMAGASDGAEGHEEDGTLMGDGGEGAGLEAEAGEEGEPSGANAEEEGEHDEAEKDKLPKHVQEKLDKRIGKEVGKRKTAEERAERAEAELKGLRERVDAEDSEVVLDVARNLGVLAETLPKGAAKGMEQLRFATSAVERLQEALEDATGDEVEIEGKPYSKADVRAKLKEWRSQEKRLNSMYGGVEAQARKEMMEIIRLGQQAKKANWKPGSKEVAKPTEAPPKKKTVMDDDEPASRVRGSDNGGREASDSRDEGPLDLVDFYEQKDKATAKTGRK